MQLKLSARLIKSLPISSLPSTPSSTLQQIASSHSKGISLYVYVLYIQVGVCVFAVAVLPFLFFSFLLLLYWAALFFFLVFKESCNL